MPFGGSLNGREPESQEYCVSMGVNRKPVELTLVTGAQDSVNSCDVILTEIGIN